MSGFGVAFNSAAHALSSVQQALTTVQNNIVNASTPGFATQRVNFSASGFELSQGLTGGLEVNMSSTRDLYLEKSVRTEMSALGSEAQKNTLLTSLQSVFSASGDSGIPGALATFAGSFAALSAAPNDLAARSNVIEAATQVARVFNQSAAQIAQVAADTAQQVKSTITSINELTKHIASLNAEMQRGAQRDAGVTANLNSSLDSLSELVDISVINNSDGSASVLLGGQSPLVLGSTAYSLFSQSTLATATAPFPGGDAGIELLDQTGADITGQATSGALGALIGIRNKTIPYYSGSQTHPGELNNLAKSFASRVNAILADAQTTAGIDPTSLFVYNSSDDTKAAATLAVSNITPAGVASANALSSNGAATELASIDNASNPADLIDGLSYGGYYGQIAGRAGRDAAEAADDLATQQDLTTQAQNQRAQASGVSLNDQAAQLLALQQAYQATARIISILNNISQTAVNLIPQG